MRSMPALAAANDSDIPLCNARRKRRICSSVTIGDSFEVEERRWYPHVHTWGILIVVNEARGGEF